MNICVNFYVIFGMVQVELISFFIGLIMCWFCDVFCVEEKLIVECFGVDVYLLLEEMVSCVFVGFYGVMFIFFDVMYFKQWYYVVLLFINFFIDLEKCNKVILFCVLEENVVIVFVCNLVQILQFFGVIFESLVFVGGGFKGVLWSQIFSDVIGLLVWVLVVCEVIVLGCVIVVGIGVGLYGDMVSIGEWLVSWYCEFILNLQYCELYQEMMSKWQMVYVDQFGFVDSGLIMLMWQVLGLECCQCVVFFFLF